MLLERTLPEKTPFKLATSKIERLVFQKKFRVRLASFPPSKYLMLRFPTFLLQNWSKHVESFNQHDDAKFLFLISKMPGQADQITVFCGSHLVLCRSTVSIHGIDLHGLYKSLKAVIQYLQKRDPKAAERAR